MRTFVAGLVVLLPLAFAAGCGESSQEKAEKTVCAAKSQIATDVHSLQTLPVAASSLETAKHDVQSIGEQLKKIQGAQGSLSGARREQVEKANATLSSELSSLTHELTNLTQPQALARVTAALDKLAASYRQAFAPVQC